MGGDFTLVELNTNLIKNLGSQSHMKYCLSQVLTGN